MESKKIFITGGTGFVGEYLREELLKEGHYLTIVTRYPEKYKSEEAKNQKFIAWNEVSSVLENTDVVINLVGENLFGQRWTEKVKKKIYSSRIESTRKLVDAMRASANKPELFISTSGSDYYKDQGAEVVDESGEPGDNFLASVCVDWEKEAQLASELGVRVAIARLGIVLEKNGGVIEKMKLPFSLFAGGPIGSGEQYLSWIHMHDLCRIILFTIKNKSIKGPFNVCSPEPVTMNQFAKSMGNVMHRPSFLKVPEFALKTILGEAAQPVIASHRLQPKVLQVNGFEFEFEDIEIALADIL